MTTYATNRSASFVPDPKRCKVHWTFCSGEVQCLLGPGHDGQPCEFMLAGRRVPDPRVPAAEIPVFERGKSVDVATYDGAVPKRGGASL